MKIFSTIVMLLFSQASATIVCAADSISKSVVVELPSLKKRVNSPDKQFTVWLEKGEYVSSEFRMEDNQTGSISTIFNAPKGVSVIGWTGDSRTMVAIILLTGGPCGYVFHQDETGAWINSEVSRPQVGRQKQCVVDCRLMESKVKFTYAVMRGVNMADVPRFYHCSFDVDAVNGQISSMNWKGLNDKEYLKNLRRYFMDSSTDKL